MNSRYFEMGGRQHAGMERFVEFERDSKDLHDLADEYETRTEAYDRTVCSFRNERGIAMPADGRESSLINRNAKKVRQEIAIKALAAGYTWNQVQSVLNNRK